MPDIVILGVGNPLMGDDGLGIEAIDLLRDHWDLPAGVELLDGGTWGMSLLPILEETREVILVDAITAHRLPGTLVTLERHQLPHHFRLRVSPHHVGLEDLFAVLEFRGTGPISLTAIGLEPESVEWGLGLSATIEQAMPTLVNSIVAWLAARGMAAVRRPPLAPH